MNQPDAVRWHPTDASKWLVGPPASGTASLRLLCIPHAGGSPSAFRPWANLLPSGVELVVAQLPGRESRFSEPALKDIDAVVAGLNSAVDHLPPLPLVMFGHSMGALIAYELAQKWQNNGRPAPVLLAVSGHGSPQNPRNYQNMLDPASEQFASQVASRYEAIPATILADPALLAFYLPLLRADFTIVTRYAPRNHAPLSCPLLALGGDTDAHLSTDALSPWQACTTGRCDVQVFSGGHFYLVQHAQAVLDTVLKQPELQPYF
jgi:medium-chain acyl-[acyl-carrier-protein] hydrolase